ncbi:hypothetical protein [Burkholderia puraquae]|nr:hypothetical protein [Burkholderia puraquae]
MSNDVLLDRVLVSRNIAFAIAGATACVRQRGIDRAGGHRLGSHDYDHFAEVPDTHVLMQP